MTEERWQQLTNWPLIVAALLFIVAYSWQVIAELHGTPRLVTESVILVTWLIFLVDYLVRLALAPHKAKWFVRHLFDLVIVVVPALRPLRLLRVFTLVHVLQRTAGAALRSRIMIYGASAAFMLIYLAALTVLEAERLSPDANITSFGDAIWWAFVTITTVGYGDYTPVTVPGRFVAVGLMVGGVAVVGTVTATLSSWVLERAAAGHEEEQPATKAQVNAVATQLHTLVERYGAPAARPRTRDGEASDPPIG
ncbi:ion transporter [Microbacterium sp. LRZ72]|uniref:ion transporter n=1 Tax=Microbacterium sp. LRZ72 TaxID=2942481 RepID=UPI0029B99E75|nr:ion transporter [Microbacterium sp. LRZ72]MDX2376794.1 ion transporter [Microbacterium sp. LRZ72]